MEEQSHSITICVNGRDLTFKTGKIARQASGAVMVYSGETILLATACMGECASDASFLPLRVDYQEKFSSKGKTLGGFNKREGRPAERETLMCRLIDRPLRPMFEEGFYNEVQVIASVLSYDGIHAPDPLAICGASAALVLSEIPLIKPVSAVRVGMVDNCFIINPTVQEMEKSVLDLMLAGTEDAVLMIEGYCDFLTENQVVDGIEEGHEAIKKISQKLSEWQQVIGKPKDRKDLRIIPDTLLEAVDKVMSKPLQPTIRITDKKKREQELKVLKEQVIKAVLPEGEEVCEYNAIDVNRAIKKITAHHMRQMILKENKRCDGRACKDLRPITVDMGFLPRTHGSAVFTRGDTQAIAVCTLGGESMGQRFEALNEEGTRRFYLQYSFPPYCVGEVGRMGPPSRREVGHGKLAERSLLATLPPKDEFPYTIRLESNTTESNGSSSMAAVCGGCAALKEAGVPIKRPIAGIAMGLILEKKDNSYAILSDILGMEDALGDMDFKITGDERGITAFQLDMKLEGIMISLIKAAITQAVEGLAHILRIMLKAAPTLKGQLSPHAPRIETIRIKPSQIATIIGPGGKQIRAITEESGADINIDDDGWVSITSVSKEGLECAREIIHNLTAEVEIGKVYKGKIAGIKDFGLFVAILSKQGLCHISEISHSRIDNIYDLFKEGDMIEVKVLDINQNGQIRLSHKVLLPTNKREEEEEEEEGL